MLSSMSLLFTASSTMASCCVVTASTPPRSSISSFRHWSKALPVLVRRSIALAPAWKVPDGELSIKRGFHGGKPVL